MDNNIRIGKVSSINYKNGTIRIFYKDKSESTTTELPVLNFNGEYKMPKVGSMVLVLHLSNGSAMGVVLGGYWGKNNQANGAKGFYRKEIAENAGEAFMEYQSGRLLINAEQIAFKTKKGTITVAEIIEKLG